MSQEYVEKSIIVDGHRVYYLEQGKGPPLLLIHGLNASSDVWKQVLPGLAERYRVVAVDFIGHGESDKPKDISFSIPFAAKFLLGILDTMGIQKAPLVGNSMGAGIALEFALQNSDRVTKLVLVDSAGLGRQVHFLMCLPSLPLVGELLNIPRKWSVRMLWRLTLYNDALVTDDFVCREYQKANLPGAYEFRLNAFRAGINLRGQKFIFQKEALQRIYAPTLIIWGVEDKIFPVRHAYIAHRYVKNSVLHIMNNCGHAPQIDDPDQFVHVVLGFLS